MPAMTGALRRAVSSSSALGRVSPVMAMALWRLSPLLCCRPLVREGRLGKLWISLFYCKQIYKSTGAKLILRS